MAVDFLWLNLKDLPYFRATLRSVEARLMHGVDLPEPALDVGCGDGHFASVTFDRKVDVGIDPAYQSLCEARQRDAYRMLVQADGAHLPFPKQSFASAMSNSVLEHIPGLEAVLFEIGRVLRPGAPFAFTVPNPGYRSQLSVPKALQRFGLRHLGLAYEEWFMRMSRTWNLYHEDGWAMLLANAGFEVERAQRYFSPSALRALEWGHYFGAPTLLPRALTGRWILLPSRWNLMLTERIVRRYYEEIPCDDGTYTFYLARRR